MRAAASRKEQAMEKRTPGNRVDVDSKGERQKRMGAEGSHVRQQEAASAQGVWVTLHNKR